MSRVYEKVFRKSSFAVYTCLFIIIVCSGYIMFFRKNLSLIWNIDGVGQYYPAFIYIGHYLQNFFVNLLHGNFSLPLYDLSIGMGEDIIGVLNYYGFGDPLNLLAVMVTKSNSAYLFTFMFFLRLWLAGAAFQYYCRCMRFDKIPTILGALCYTFSGFAIYGGAMYSEWLSVLIYFPLILAGVEKIIKDKGKPYLFIFSVAYGALCGFYYLYMVSLFLMIYCIVRLAAIFKDNGGKLIKILKKCFRCVIWYLIGICLAAPILLPSLAAYGNSERRTGGGGGILACLFNFRLYLPHINVHLRNIIFNFFYNRRCYLAGITVVQLICVLFLFILPKSRRTLQLKIGVITILIALHLPIINYLFSAFGADYDRWVFIVHFVLAVVLAHVLTEFCGIEIRISLLKIFKIKRCIAINGAAVFIVLNIICNIWLLYSKTDVGEYWQEEFIRYDHIDDYTDSPFNCLEAPKKDEGVFRISNDILTDVNGRPENVAMLNNYYSLSYWFSIVNGDTQSFVDEIAGENQLWRSYGMNNDPILETFAGVKYAFRKDGETVPQGYVLLQDIMYHDEKWQVYYNPGYFGMAYVRNYAESQKLWEEKSSYEEYFSSIYEKIKQNPEQAAVTYDNQTNIMSITVNARENSEVVILLPYTKNWHAFLDGEKTNLYKTDGMYCSIPLQEQGYHEIILTYSSTEFIIGIFLMVMAMIVIIMLIGHSMHIRKCRADLTN